MLAKGKLYSFIFALCIIGYGWLYVNMQQNAYPLGCMFYQLTHMPCPACGSTRSVCALLQGDFIDALKANPLGYIIAIALIILPVWIIWDLLRNKNSFWHFYKNTEVALRKRKTATLAIILVIINWMWNIYKYF